LLIGAGVNELGYDVINVAHNTGLVDDVHIYADNVGQHVAWNEAYSRAKAEGAKYFLRIDDDCEFLSKRWLKKLVACSRAFEDKFIVSPTVKGLKHPPARSQICTVSGIEVEFLVDAIGGICRLHPISLLDEQDVPYVADVRKPLGAGDATGIASWAREHKVPMAYVRQVRVRHSTARQEKADPTYFENHGLYQVVPYIPTYEEPYGTRSDTQ
jgi:glycosyltransferase involved in cell wall biosynthesis